MAINFSLKKNNIQFILFSAIIAFLLASIWYLYKSSPIEALSLEPDSEQIHRGKKSMKKIVLPVMELKEKVKIQILLKGELMQMEPT